MLPKVPLKDLSGNRTVSRLYGGALPGLGGTLPGLPIEGAPLDDWTQMTKDLHKNAVMSLNHEPHLYSKTRLQHPITETRYCLPALRHPY